MKLEPPSYLLPWLECQEFLTARLRGVAPDVHMKILQPGQPAKNMGLMREIVMYAGDDACWYAITEVPVDTLAEHQELFARLQHEMLGDIIFDPTANITRVDLEIDHMVMGDTTLWLRRSTFAIEEARQFLLTEIFLPGLAKYADVAVTQ